MPELGCLLCFSHMKDLFNRTFFRFTLGFIGILLVSFALAAIVSHLDTDGPTTVRAGQ